MCVRGIDFAALSKDLRLDFATVPTVAHSVGENVRALHIYSDDLLVFFSLFLRIKVNFFSLLYAIYYNLSRGNMIPTYDLPNDKCLTLNYRKWYWKWKVHLKGFAPSHNIVFTLMSTNPDFSSTFCSTCIMIEHWTL